MTNTKPTAGQIAAGVALGLLLLPFGLLIGANLLMSEADRQSELAGIGQIANVVMFFGSLQAVVILPAALVAALWTKRPGIARGLLYFGAALAVLNGILWIFSYRDYGHPPIY